MSISKKTSEGLFSFAYNLIPDDLEARQLVLDAVYAFLIEHQDHKIEAKEQDLIDIKFYYKKVFEIALKRMPHSGQYSEQALAASKSGDFSFFKLPMLERAVLFLRHRAKMHTNAIALITSLGKVEVINHLFLARFHLLKI